MNVYVSHISALRYWRREEGLGKDPLAQVTTLADVASGVKEVKNADPASHGIIFTSDNPLNVLVPNTPSRRFANALRPRVWSEAIPDGAFRMIAPNVYVSTPEFVFVQMASQLSLVELAQLGNELCGGYYLCATTGFDEHVGKKPLTSHAKLLSFVRSVPQARGAQKALRALRWVANHCNSPMETNTLLMLCLPSRMGGWQLRLPEVNKEMEASKRLARYVGGTTYIPDFTWEIKVGRKTIYVVGEYDSSECHDSDKDAQATRIRRNDMKSMGYLVTSINKSQMASAKQFEYPARQIARDLGVYRRALSEKQLKKQDALLQLLRRESYR